jgi:hypothetical protein
MWIMVDIAATCLDDRAPKCQPMTRGMAHPSEDTVTYTIAAIYEAALAPDRWLDVLEHLRAMFGLSFAASVVRDAGRTKADGVAVGVDHADYQEFLD